MKRKLEVLSTGGDFVTLDMSDSACSKFGFKHGERINLGGDKGTVIGVAPPTVGCERSEKMILWYALDKDKGRVTYSPYGIDVKRLRS